MNAGAWGALAWLAAVTAAATIILCRKRRAGRQPAAGAGSAPVPGGAPSPGALPSGRGRSPVRPAPAPAPRITPQEAAALARLCQSRAAGTARGACAAREVADGLRGRFPGLDDTTLGLITLDLHGYALAIAAALPGDPAWALRAVTSVLGLAAEELTRLGRMEEEVPFDR